MKEVGDVIGGFKLVKKEYVERLDAICYRFVHLKSGATVVKVAADDKNKTFGVVFKTFTTSDEGIPHILEHCVLHGSESFPVKSPLQEIMKGSLKTYANAYTAKDHTCYPVASENEKDYFNLMHIYLDAVFKPLVLKDERIFQQEGWHYELKAKDDPLLYTGVVYGEMKGAYSNRNTYENYHLFKNIFPGSPYRYDHGGNPKAIPSLTWEKLKEYYKKHYHPSNCMIMLYGDANLKKELSFIDEKYLSQYESPQNYAKVNLRPGLFKNLKKVQTFYPASAKAEAAGNTSLSLSFMIDDFEDIYEAAIFPFLVDAIFDNKSAPGKLALREAGIGSDVDVSHFALRHRVVKIKAHDAEPGQAEQFYSIVMDCIKQGVEIGVDKEALFGGLNQMLLLAKDKSGAFKGLALQKLLIKGFLYHDDPFRELAWDKIFESLIKNFDIERYSELLDKYLLKNSHQLLLICEPSKQLAAKQTYQVLNELKNYKASLSDKEINSLINKTHQLVEYQNSDDPPEAKATIPRLTLKDISRRATHYKADVKMENGVKVLHFDTDTNNIAYLRLYFDLRAIQPSELPYASFIADLFTKVNTKNYSLEELEREVKDLTGGFYSFVDSYLKPKNVDKLLPSLVAGAMTLISNTSKTGELLSEIIQNTDYDNYSLVKATFNMVNSSFNNVLNQGSDIAKLRIESYLTPTALFDDLAGGYEYYLFIKRVVDNFDQELPKVVEKIKAVAQKLFTANNLTVGLICSKEDYNKMVPEIRDFVNLFSVAEKTKRHRWRLKPEVKNEAFIASSQVQHVNMGGNLLGDNHKWSGAFYVLNTLIARDWLHPQVRVQRGAYGGYSTIKRNGVFVMSSFRDPNLLSTIDIFRKTAKFLEEVNIDDAALTQLIIGTISNIDRPKSITQQGEEAFINYFTGRMRRGKQKERDEVIEVTAEQLKSYAKRVQEVINLNIHCTFGNEKAVKEAMENFKSVIVL